mgnify:CR=1 FL=1
MKGLYPKEYVESTYEIDFEGLYRKGYRGVIFDIDNNIFIPFKEINEQLKVALKKNDTDWEILSWQTISQPEEIQQTLPVWQGLE